MYQTNPTNLQLLQTDPAAVQEISWNVYSRRFTRPWNFSDTPCIDFWQGPTLLNRWLFASWRSRSPSTCKRRRLDSFLFLWQRCVCQPEGLQSDVKRSIPRMDIASLRQYETPTRTPETHVEHRRSDCLVSRFPPVDAGTTSGWIDHQCFPRRTDIWSVSACRSLDPRVYRSRIRLFYAGRISNFPLSLNSCRRSGYDFVNIIVAIVWRLMGIMIGLIGTLSRQ